VSCAKTAEPIDVFGLLTRVSRRKHEFNRIRQLSPMCPHRRAHCRIRLNHPSAAAMRPYVKIKLLGPLVVVVVVVKRSCTS